MRISGHGYLLGLGLVLLSVANAILAGGIGRFTVKSPAKKPLAQGRQLTPSELYAQALTRRKPTPRSTAQRRQVSDAPPVTNSVPLGIATADLQLGYLSIDANGSPSLSDESTSRLDYSASPSWVVGTQKRITTGASDYPLLGLTACDDGNGDLGVITTDYVCLVGVAMPGTSGGEAPAALGTTLGSSTAVSTDVWAFNYALGTITPVWVNPDGNTRALTLMVNQLSGKIVATPNPVLFPVTHGSQWVAFTFQYVLL